MDADRQVDKAKAADARRAVIEAVWRKVREKAEATPQKLDWRGFLFMHPEQQKLGGMHTVRG